MPVLVTLHRNQVHLRRADEAGDEDDRLGAL